MIEVMDIPLYDLGMKQAVKNIIEVCSKHTRKENRCISATGAHGLVLSKKDAEFKRLLKEFYFNLPDGRPAAFIGRIKGAKYMEQCTGPDFFERILISTSSLPIKHFFCGGKKGVAEELKINCEIKFCNKNIVGVDCPPFRTLTDEEMRLLGNEINSKNVDIVWIGLSTPKQEFFANKLKSYINVHFIVTVGAAFDFHSNRIRKAPAFLKIIGLEWFFRLCSEPRRLFRRYAEIVPKFIYFNLQELFTNILKL